MSGYPEIERLFADARPPRAGSTGWYDACDLLATEIKARLRERFGRGFPVEVYGDEISLIVRIRGDGYGVDPWGINRALDAAQPLSAQIDEVLPAIEACVEAKYVRE